LYFNAITKGISEIPEIELKKRNFIRKLHSRLGQEKFYNLLIKLDPLAKEKIISTDTQRTIRAYEVKLITKKSIFQWARNTKSEFLSYDIKKIFLDIPRDNLLKNIEKRTNEMITTGCVKEVKSFLKLNIDKNLSANKLIGVKELESYIRGNISLNQAKDLIIIKTRQYAKSQKTWSRGHMKNWKKLYSKDFSALLKKALKVLS
jgi:tRNA dimethylallyltransferase